MDEEKDVNEGKKKQVLEAKKIKNKVLGTNLYLSGSYPDQDNDGTPLNDWWTDALKEIGNPGLWQYTIISSRQVKLRNKLAGKK